MIRPCTTQHFCRCSNNQTDPETGPIDPPEKLNVGLDVDYAELWYIIL